MAQTGESPGQQWQNNRPHLYQRAPRRRRQALPTGQYRSRPDGRKNHKSALLVLTDRTTLCSERSKSKIGLAIARQQLAYYNPNTANGKRRLSDKWRYMFQETGDKFIGGSMQIPIANKQYRLRQLQKLYNCLVD